MSESIGGQRPRPRVALLGEFPDRDLERCRHMFPTVWQGLNTYHLKQQVDAREVDVLVIAPGVNNAGEWVENAHVICFSQDIEALPGPTTRTKVREDGFATTEEFVLPDVPLPISRRRQADLADLANVRGWMRLILTHGSGIHRQKSESTAFNEGAIICERHTNLPLAVCFVRDQTRLGVAWLPFSPIDQTAWVEVLVTRWAEFDQERLPHFGDWILSPQWMTSEEEQIRSEIEDLERRKQETIARIDKQIGEAFSRFAEAQLEANMNMRRLITAQGNELLHAVSTVLQDIGFKVNKVNEWIPEGKPKREDLRLRQSIDQRDEWEAIVEVRGYARSGGTTSDLQRLARFANLYLKEKGNLPAKRIYIVNGQLELPPPQRAAPLASSPEDIDVFGESDGLLIWTVDLFRALKTSGLVYAALRESIQNASGRWNPETVGRIDRTSESGAND